MAKCYLNGHLEWLYVQAFVTARRWTAAQAVVSSVRFALAKSYLYSAQKKTFSKHFFMRWSMRFCSWPRRGIREMMDKMDMALISLKRCWKLMRWQASACQCTTLFKTKSIAVGNMYGFAQERSVQRRPLTSVYSNDQGICRQGQATSGSPGTKNSVAASTSKLSSLSHQPKSRRKPLQVTNRFQQKKKQKWTKYKNDLGTARESLS